MMRNKLVPKVKCNNQQLIIHIQVENEIKKGKYRLQARWKNL